MEEKEEDIVITTFPETDDVGLLKCRIDRQSELICILKKRADKFMSKYKEKEEEYGKLDAENNQIKGLYQEEEKKVASLETSSFTITKAHQDLLLAKRNMDGEFEQLKNECSVLRWEIIQLSNKLKSEDHGITKLHESIVRKSEELNKLQAEKIENEQRYRTKLQTTESAMLSTNKQMCEEIDRLRKELAGSNKNLSLAKEQLEHSSKQESDTKIQLNAMMNKYSAEKKRNRELEEQFNRKLDKFSSSLEIDVLQKKIVELEEKHDTVVQNFTAYKDHSQELLLKEKSLNLQLRKLKLPYNVEVRVE